jgi:hypothetical protein
MGYDSAKVFNVPLYYVYTKADPKVFHVSNSDSNPKGNDNRFCGHLNFPCETIGHAVSVYRYDNQNQVVPNVVGIITDYKLNTSPTIGSTVKETKI